MKKWIMPLVFGWFFAMQSPWEGDPSNGVILTQVVGPFKSELQCKAAFDETKAVFESFGLMVKYHPCQFKQEA